MLSLQVLVEIPCVLSQAVVYSGVVYSMIQFKWTAVKFLWFFYFMLVTFLYFTFYGMMTVAMTPNSAVASISASAFYGMWNLFCGFLIPRPVSSSNSVTLLFKNNIYKHEPKQDAHDF